MSDVKPSDDLQTFLSEVNSHKEFKQGLIDDLL